MSDESMETRTSRLEWEVQALKERQTSHDERMVELATRIDIHHKEVMGAIGSLRDEKARNEGAMEARARMIKWLSLGLAAVGTMIALGWINSSEAAWLPVKIMTDPPIPVQYYAREVP